MFELKGFEFLLTSIGTNLNNVQSKQLNTVEVKGQPEETKSEVIETQLTETMEESDLNSLLGLDDKSSS